MFLATQIFIGFCLFMLGLSHGTLVHNSNVIDFCYHETSSLLYKTSFIFTLKEELLYGELRKEIQKDKTLVESTNKFLGSYYPDNLINYKFVSISFAAIVVIYGCVLYFFGKFDYCYITVVVSFLFFMIGFWVADPLSGEYQKNYLREKEAIQKALKPYLDSRTSADEAIPSQIILDIEWMYPQFSRELKKLYKNVFYPTRTHTYFFYLSIAIFFMLLSYKLNFK